MMILYFVDETKEAKLRKEYIDSKSCVGIIMIDNYEETMQQLDIDTKPQIIAEVDKNLYEYANETEGIMIKTDKDRFVYIFEYKYLEKIKESKFAILDTIKEINIPGRNQLTLSIAISNEGKTNKEKYKTAESAMDVVLGRGGDQATIRENGKYQLNLWKANELIFLESGILAEHMAITNVCTHCNSEILYSHRTMGNKRGNLCAFLALK